MATGLRRGFGPQRPMLHEQAWTLARQHELGEVLASQQQVTLSRRRRWGLGLLLGGFVVSEILGRPMDLAPQAATQPAPVRRYRSRRVAGADDAAAAR